MWTLAVKSGPLAGRRIEVGKQMSIGRQEADIAIDDREVSRRHAVIRPVDGGLEIEDLGSLNGTWVNERRLEAPRRLAAADVVRVGSTSLEVEVEVEVESSGSDLTVIRPEAVDRTALRTTSGPSPPSRETPSPAPVEAPPAQVAAPPPKRLATPKPAGQPFAVFAPARPVSRRRSAATRMLTPMIVSVAIVMATAAALVFYFAQR